ncbi:MAG: D-glycerate dehydrogenase [Pseudomonadota bacterium]
MTKVLITRELPASVMAAARDCADVTERDAGRPMSLDEARAALETYEIILPTLGDSFGPQAFDGITPVTKLIANFGVGYNHIDVTSAASAGIAVTNTPGAVTDATADIAMMLTLMSCRRASEGERMVRQGAWTGWHPVQLLGQHLGAKTLGIVGMGRIGKAIARRAHFGFGMNIVFYNRSKVPDFGVPGTQAQDLSELMHAADVVVMAVPATPETHHMLGAEQLAEMKPNAHVVNIARGDVVDEEALIEALQEGQIAGAGLDVYEFEPKVPQSLMELDNVTLLPHLGTAALEVRENMGFMAVDNIRAYLAGNALPNKV